MVSASSDWSIEDELAAMAGVSSIAEACLRLGISESRSFDLQERLAWASKGSESFTYAFDLLEASGRKSTYLLKAFVPTPFTISVAGALARHLQNSERLSLSGARVPRVFGARSGTVLTEFIPFDAFEFLARISTDSAQWLSLARQCIGARRSVFSAGFRPVGGDVDLRTDGERVYVVDLGSDLGVPSGGRDGSVEGGVVDEVSWIQWRLRIVGGSAPDVSVEQLKIDRDQFFEGFRAV